MKQNRLGVGGYDAAALGNSVSLVQSLLDRINHNVDIIEADKKVKPNIIRWANSTLQKPVETMLIRPDHEGQLNAFRDNEEPE